jgi:CheY-like chemotaxis protein/signal transduction histidine kinase
MTTSTPTPSEDRVLVLLPPGPDEALGRAILDQAGLASFFCADVATLCHELETGAGAVLLAQESLEPPALRELIGVLGRQEPWSDFPLVIFFDSVGSVPTSLRMLDMLEPLGNVTILERPVRPMTLVSALRAALRARRQQYEVRDLLRQRDEALRDDDEFLTLLAHELRTPLGAIRNAIHILDQVGSPLSLAVQQRAVLARQTGRLARLVDGVLEVHRLISRRLALRREPFDLTDILGRSLEGVHSLGGGGMFVGAPASLPVEGDPDRLSQVFQQLFAEATQGGASVSVRVDHEGSEAVVRISATDLDWPAEEEARAPDRLTSVLRSLNQPAGGLAVALLLVRNLIELHGGSVSLVRSEDELVVRLPLREVATEQGVARTKTAPGVATSRRVLVVEDSSDARESLRLVLQLWGHKVETAEDGVRALQVARAGSPEVALVDIGLPGLDGCEVARQLRAVFGQNILLVAVTGYGEPHDRSRALEAGFDAYLVKPVAPHLLRETLARPVLEAARK